MGCKNIPYSTFVQNILEQQEGRDITALSAEERAWRLKILKAQWAAVDAVECQKLNRLHIHKEG